MNKHTEQQLIRFMSVLKALKMPKDKILGVVSFLKTEEMASEILQNLKAKDFKVTPEEAESICLEVIAKNL